MKRQSDGKLQNILWNRCDARGLIMIYELIYNDLKASHKIIIFGAGDNGRFIAEYLKLLDFSAIEFTDSNSKKCNTIIDGIFCRDLESLNAKDENCLIITPLTHNESLVSSFKSKGFKRIYSWNEMLLFIRSDEHMAEKYLQKNKNLSESLQSNRQFCGMYNGERCFVLGTGPSLKEQDLKLLKNEFVFTVNQFMRSEQFKDVKTTFHVWNDSGYFNEMGDRKTVRERVELCKKIDKSVVSFFPYSKSIEFVKKNYLDKYLDIKYYQEMSGIPVEAINLNLSSLMPEVGTAVLSAVNIAFYMGFSTIYLLGCDCTDILTIISAKSSEIASPQYVYGNDNSVKMQVKSMLEERPLEFIYELQAKKFAAFRKINTICRENGVKIYNCTKGGILEGISRRKYEDVLSQ